MSVHRIGKTLLIDSFDDPLRFNPKVEKKKLHFKIRNFNIFYFCFSCVQSFRNMLMKVGLVGNRGDGPLPQPAPFQPAVPGPEEGPSCSKTS